MRKSEQTEGMTELVVYSCHCVEHGPELHIFDEDDIRAAGGIYEVETELQRDSYWFVRLGTIEGKRVLWGGRIRMRLLRGYPRLIRVHGTWVDEIRRSNAGNWSARFSSRFFKVFQNF